MLTRDSGHYRFNSKRYVAMKVMNLSNDSVLEFDADTDASYAVAYAYCEENGKLPQLFNACHSRTVPSFLKTLPMVYGEMSVSCGDWSAMYNYGPNQ